MMRIYNVSRSKLCNRILTTCKSVQNQEGLRIIRLQSTKPHSSGDGKVKYILIGSSIFGLSFGGAIAYASYDPDFRKSVEASIPYSSTFLGFLLGPVQTTTLPPPLPKLQQPVKAPEPVKPKEPLPLPPKKAVDAPASPPPAPAASTALPPAPPTTQEKPKPLAKPKSEKPPAEKSQLDIEAVAAKDRAKNKALSEKLEGLQKKLQAETDEAVKCQTAAAEAIKGHVSKVYKAIEDPLAGETSAIWTDVKKSAESKSKVEKLAANKSNQVRNLSENIKKTLEEARASKATVNNSSLLPTEEKVTKLLSELDTAETQVKILEGEERVLQEYRKAVTEARQQLQAEVSSIAPEVIVGEQGAKLTEEELNQLLLHAHRKAVHLQKQLAKQQTIDQVHLKGVIDKQRVEDYKQVEENMKYEIEKVKRNMEFSYQKKLEESREQLERELQQQLKRQAAAFSEHEKDIVAAQEAELNRLWEEKLRQALYNEQTGFRAKIGQATARVKGINEGLKARAELQKAAERAQQLWLASQSLSDAIRLGPKDAHGWENKLCSLNQEIKAIKNIADSSDSLPAAVLAAVPSIAVERGIFTREGLKERWSSVSRVCRKLALIGNEGGSMWRRFVSSIQGTLYVSNFVAPPSEERLDNPVDIDRLNTYEILDRVGYYLDIDDLDLALRYLNLLDGAPRLAASDWLKEARLHLETSQAADALLAYASKVSAESLIR